MKVLFVDDDKDLLELMGKIFIKKGIDFYSACNSKEGIEKALTLHPDIIILDIALPDSDGFEVCRQIKSNGSTRKIPVIFVTGKFFSENDKVKSLKLGADDYIVKPVNVDELLARIDTILRGYARTAV